MADDTLSPAKPDLRARLIKGSRAASYTVLFFGVFFTLMMPTPYRAADGVATMWSIAGMLFVIWWVVVGLHALAWTGVPRERRVTGGGVGRALLFLLALYGVLAVLGLLAG